MRYLLTFTCYGHRLHGHSPGTVDRQHHAYGARLALPDPRRLAYVTAIMAHRPFQVDERRRSLVLDALHRACRKPGWILWSAHVRPTHVHVVIEAAAPPERVLRQLKASATAILRAAPASDVVPWPAVFGFVRLLRQAYLRVSPWRSESSPSTVLEATPFGVKPPKVPMSGMELLMALDKAAVQGLQSLARLEPAK